MTRTRYLYVANVPLYQMSYIPIDCLDYTISTEKSKRFFALLQKNFFMRAKTFDRLLKR